MVINYAHSRIPVTQAIQERCKGRGERKFTGGEFLGKVFTGRGLARGRFNGGRFTGGGLK